MRIVADENMPAVETLLGDVAEVVRLPGRAINREALRHADALLVRSVTQVSENLIHNTPIKFVGTATAGMEHVDRVALRAAGIGFASAPGANANSVVEYVMAAIAAVDTFLERLLDEGCVGIVGFGHVGGALAARLGDLGIRHIAYDPWLTSAQLPVAASLEEVLQCDVICLHAELTTEQPWPSRHLLDAHNLGDLSDDQLLINASRGAVVDNLALLHRLRGPSAPEVVLDVWEGEPAINAQLLEKVQLGTAHIAGYSLDAKIQATKMLCDAMVEAELIGSLPDNVPLSVQPPLMLSPVQSQAGLIRQLLAGSYDIHSDDVRLRAVTLGKDPAYAATGFDELRKHYSERRELLGRKVQLAASMQEQASVVAAMGCTPLSEGT